MVEHVRRVGDQTGDEVAKLMNKGHRTYQRWESGYYGLELEDIAADMASRGDEVTERWKPPRVV